MQLVSLGLLLLYMFRTRFVSETCRVIINQVKQAASRWLFTYAIF